MLVRVSLFWVGSLVSVAVVLVLGWVGRAGPPSVCGAPPLCPGRDGRAGFPSTCGAPDPCCCFAGVVALPLVFPCSRCSRPHPLCPPPPGLWFGGVVVATLFFPPPLRACWLLLVAARGRLPPPDVPPTPPAGCSGFVGVFALLLFVLAARLFAVPWRVRLPAALPHPSWFVLRGCCRPAAYFSSCALCLLVAALLLVCRRSPPPPPVCVRGCCLLAPCCPLCWPCLLAAARPFAVFFRLVPLHPPPPAGFCLAGVRARVAWCFAVPRAVLCGPEAVPRTRGPWPGGPEAVTAARTPSTPSVSGISLFSDPRDPESEP